VSIRVFPRPTMHFDPCRALTARIILHMLRINVENLRFWMAAIGFAAVLQGCTQQPPPAPAVEDPVLKARHERDLAFKRSPQSPIPERDRARFQGLDYFAVDPKLRFRVKLNRFPTPERIRMGTNTGEIRDGLRYGFFEFHAEGQDCRLLVYRMEDAGDAGQAYLFMPFRDATTGTETYGGGRYLDLPENTSGIYDLDFNRAYNPSCAYGTEFSCPVPPEENRLPIPIRAGEKVYRLATSH
jgi:uncharacterized protein (DUF1684 family)